MDTAYAYTGPWLSSLGQDLASTASDVTFAYARNPAVQIVERTSSNAAWSYIGYTNTDEDYVPNGLNQYATVDAAAFVYDDRGNLTDDGTSTYSYDLFNRLLAVDGPVDDTAYLIDPLGRMAQETAPAATRRLLYDGDRIVGEYTTAGNLSRRYVPGPGVDEVVAYYFSDGTTFFQPITDERGSVIAYTASSGNVTGGVNTYDDFGQPDADPYGRFQYTGQARLTDTPLYYYKARVYHPGLGRFLQTDPIGYVDSLNLYAYVMNDPINGIDPTGLVECPEELETSGECVDADAYVPERYDHLRDAEGTPTSDESALRDLPGLWIPVGEQGAYSYTGSGFVPAETRGHGTTDGGWLGIFNAPITASFVAHSHPLYGANSSIIPSLEDAEQLELGRPNYIVHLSGEKFWVVVLERVDGQVQLRSLTGSIPVDQRKELNSRLNSIQRRQRR